MKKILILAAAIPVLGLGVGYGVGFAFADKAEAALAQAEALEKVATAEPAKSGTELLLDAAEANAEPVHAEAPAAHGEDSHGAAPKTAEAPKAHMSNQKNAMTSRDVVQLGSMMVPVYKARSVTYVVADFGVAMPDAQTAAHYRIAENSARLRDAIFASFRSAAENPRMRRAALDSDWLSSQITADLKAEFDDAQEVLFLSLYKKDVPRS